MTFIEILQANYCFLRKLLMYIFIIIRPAILELIEIAGLIYLFKTYPYMEAILKNVLSR